MRPGDAFEPIERNAAGISVADVNDVIYGRSVDLGLIEALAALPEFAAEGRTLFAERARRRRLGQRETA